MITAPPKSPPPALSSILIAPDTYDGIAATIRHLRAQRIADQIEVVIVTPRADQLRLPREEECAFHSVRIVPIATLGSLASARAVGVEAASAPLIAFNEDHSFPEPGWAAAFVDAHRRGYAGVAPQMKNANPDSALSWAAMYLHFGGVVEPDGGFETTYPSASHNMCYTKAALRDAGDALAERMLAELFLHEDLQRRGHRFWVEPSAVTRHVNMSRIGPAIQHAWAGGRLYGGLRAIFGRWPLARRIVYAGGAPLIPLLRLWRVVPLLRRTESGRRLIPRVLPPMLMLLVIHAAGEAAGYLLGVGDTRVSYSDWETHRERHVRAEERALWS